jgi:hypothetical protein
MRLTIFLLTALLLVLSSCDPVHDLHLENQTSKSVIVIYRPLIEIAPTGRKIESIRRNNITYAKVVLGSGEKMRIGNVIANYIPEVDDVELEFLEICMERDTMKLIGKKSILSAIQEVDKLDWRLVLRDK